MNLALRELADLDGAGASLLRFAVGMGFSEAVARDGLRAEFDAWTDGAIAEVLGELGPADDSRKPSTVLVIAAGTLPASAVRQVLMARLLGARVLLKPATGQEALVHALSAVDNGVEPCLFAGSDAAALGAAVARSDSIVVLGSDATVDAVRAAVPASKAFVGYGHRLSVTWVDAEMVEPAAGPLALDLCAWDQAGCLSPQVVWTTGDPHHLAAAVAEALRDVERELPMRVDQDVRSTRYSALTLAQMMGSVVETETAVVATLPTGAFRPSPGFRTLWVLPADEIALRTLADTEVLSTVGVCGEAPALPEGVRVCPVGEMQRPPLTWQHDGRPNLRVMLRP